MQYVNFEDWLNSSYLSKSNQTYINRIYVDFLQDPNSVDISWRNIFKKLFIEHQSKNLHDSSFLIETKFNNIDFIYIKILQLINSFRIYGHQYSNLDPLGLSLNQIKNNFLELEYYKFISLDFQKQINTIDLGFLKNTMTLKNIYQFLKNTYCGSIGIEYMHILDINKVLWIQDYYESNFIKYNDLHEREQKQFLEEIIAAEELERYLGAKFPGVKRFSLEGGDVLIPMLKEAIRYSVLYYDVHDVLIGMAHRGRLNVLVNILGKNPQDLFNEFRDNYPLVVGTGDVKYHQGLYSNMIIENNPIFLSLLFNPSHLEIITPVVMGVARSKIDQLSNKSSNKITKVITNEVLPIVIHGDAAISAQGVIQESFNMSNTYAYGIGGAIHIVINNQIGFTTSNIYNMRSTLYCTDIAKMIQAPILHVNSDDVNAVIFAIRFAINFRNKFKTDVVIDLVCYRRHGHNEIDEPSVTQPIMYHKIRNHPTVSSIYFNKLSRSNIVTSDDVQNMINLYHKTLDTQNCVLTTWKSIRTSSTFCSNNITQNTKNMNLINIIDSKYLKNLAYIINSIPSHIIMNDRVKKIYCERVNMALGKRLFDWGGAETLAYATLLDQGYSIRLSGEDVTRGTFFHRHVVIHNQEDGKLYIPLMHVKSSQGLFYAWDSVLSEESALAFEYGYATISPSNTLVIWEAQFGDFSNGAQVVIDQFISSGEQKWNQLCGLIILLPHGYEGQGPEHSSCRIERFLQLCAENNMWVCIPSVPAQIYHILREQAINRIKKPLIIISPKSLLRHAMATSSIEDLVNGSFNTVFDEIDSNCIFSKVDKVIICMGKIYYDLLYQRNQIRSYNIAIIRIEQLYPFPYSDIQVILQNYKHVKNFVWCQEEPKNQGAWYYISRYFCEDFGILLDYIGRPDSAAPAVGRFSTHQIQQKKIIKDALDLKL